MQYLDEDVSKHDLDLKVSIPQKLDVDMIDKKIDFQIWTVTSKQLEAINRLKRQYPIEIVPEISHQCWNAYCDNADIGSGTG